VLASVQFEINYSGSIGIVFRLYRHLISALIAEDDHRIWNYTTSTITCRCQILCKKGKGGYCQTITIDGESMSECTS